MPPPILPPFPPLRIGKFTTKQLDQIVSDTVPASRTNAVVLVPDADGIAVTVKMTKPTTHGTWEVEGTYRRDWSLHGDQELGAKIVFSW